MFDWVELVNEICTQVDSADRQPCPNYETARLVRGVLTGRVRKVGRMREAVV